MQYRITFVSRTSAFSKSLGDCFISKAALFCCCWVLLLLQKSEGEQTSLCPLGDRAMSHATKARQCSCSYRLMDYFARHRLDRDVVKVFQKKKMSYVGLLSSLTSQLNAVPSNCTFTQEMVSKRSRSALSNQKGHKLTSERCPATRALGSARLGRTACWGAAVADKSPPPLPVPTYCFFFPRFDLAKLVVRKPTENEALHSPERARLKQNREFSR